MRELKPIGSARKDREAAWGWKFLRAHPVTTRHRVAAKQAWPEDETGMVSL